MVEGGYREKTEKADPSSYRSGKNAKKSREYRIERKVERAGVDL